MSRMLILSFSPIATDARVLKQVVEFGRTHEVITCGYGPAPEGVVEHIRIPDDASATQVNGRLITLRMFRRAHWSLPGIRFVRDALRGRSFDVVIANDAEAVPVALTAMSRHGVLADLHEYGPRLHEENEAWMRRISPYITWLIRRYVARASAWTTVGRGLAEEYQRVFGFLPEIVTNAAPAQTVSPREVAAPIRLVHSGACLRNRHLDESLRAVLEVPGYSLDLYLTPNDPGHLGELREIADSSGGRIRVHDPVPYADLLPLLNTYDLGVHLLAPTNFNNEWALPNKFFDYVQARLGVIIGPSPEMAEYVRRDGLGVVAAGFDADALSAALRKISPADVEGFKRASDQHARELSSETQVAIWRRIISQLEGTHA